MKHIHTKTLMFMVLLASLMGVFTASLLVDKPVEFSDPNLELAIRDLLHHYDKHIFQSQLLGFVELDLSGREIRTLEGIEHFRNLEILNLRRNHISDVSSLGKLTNLRILDLGYNRIVDLEEARFDRLGNLQLIALNLDHNTTDSENSDQTRLSDITLLSQFNSLVRLSLDDNHISDVSPLAKLSNLQELILIENRLENLIGLEGLPQLEELNVRENQLVDISAIADLTSLRYLNLHSNQTLEDISPLENLTNLETLILRNVPIGEQITLLENMVRLQRLNIRNCSVTDITALVRLMEAGALQDNPDKHILAYLDILENDISDDPYALSGLSPFWDNISDKYPIFVNDAILPPPVFSVYGGYYQNSFYLALSSDMEEIQIHYTLDGSIPSKDSPIYSEPFMINAQTNNLGELLAATVVRARVFENDGFDASPTVTQTYFVRRDSAEIFSLPVVSFVTDSDFFFDPESGIYENFRERGKKWEKPIHIAFFDTNKHLAFEKEAQVRIHGSATRGLSQKSLRFYAENDFGDPPIFEYEFFPGYIAQGTGEVLTTFKTLLFRNSGNDYRHTFFKDAFIQRLVAHTSLDIQAYQPVNVFFNGDYWGIYNIRERFDEFYLENHYQLSPDEVVIHKITDDFDFYDQPPDANEFLAMREFILTHNMAEGEYFSQVLTQIDIENFIDNQIIYIYAANGDWLRNNVMFWKKTVDEYDENALVGHDGRWRWMVIDMDLGFRDAEANLLTDAVGEMPGALLANALLKNDHFRTEFINRFADHLNTSFEPSRVVEEIDVIEAMLEPDIEMHIRRWKTMGNSLDQWHANVELLREFALARPGFMREQIIEEFNLSGMYELSVIADQAHGFVRVNSIDIIDSTPGVDNASNWSGVYFNDVPIILSAQPSSGYEFMYWEGVEGHSSFDQTISLIPGGDLQITAIFQKKPSN